MSSIKTYDDLLAEEKRLQAVLYSHGQSIKDSFAATKASLNPFKAALHTAKNLFTRNPTNPLMNFGLDFGVDVLFRRFVLAKAGWVTKIILPFLVKNYSTYIIKEKPRYKFVQKIFDFFKGSKSAASEEGGNLKEDISDTADNVKQNLHEVKDDIVDTNKEVQQSANNT